MKIKYTLLQKTVLHEKYFYTKREPIQIPFSIQKLTIFFYLDINLCAKVLIKHKRKNFKWLQNDFMKD